LKAGGKEAVKKKTAKAEAQQAESLEKMRQHLTPSRRRLSARRPNSGMVTATQWECARGERRADEELPRCELVAR
jgi:hypothetical protein